MLTLVTRAQAAWGHLHADRGVSMRFPRFIRLRPDKVSPPLQTTTTNGGIAIPRSTLGCSCFCVCSYGTANMIAGPSALADTDGGIWA